MQKGFVFFCIKICLLTNLLLFVSPKKALAQGTCRCKPLAQSKACVLTEDNCEDGYVCVDCSVWGGKPECDSVRVCVESAGYRCSVPGKGNGVSTAIGCIPINNSSDFVGWLLSRLIFVASGVAFLLMAFATFQIVTSSGDAKKVQAGKETLTSAVAGLIFIILSVLLLKLIGVDILHLPGF